MKQYEMKPIYLSNFCQCCIYSMFCWSNIIINHVSSHVRPSQGDTYVRKTAPEPPKRWEPSPCLVQLVASISPMQSAHGLRWSNLGARWSAPGSRLQLRFQRLSTNCLAARSRYALTQMVLGCVKIQQLWILVLSSWSIADLTARSWCRFWHCRRRPWTLRIDFKGSDSCNVRVTQIWAVRYVTVKKLQKALTWEMVVPL